MDDIERQEYEEALDALQNAIEGFEHDIFLLSLEIAERGLRIEALIRENEELKKAAVKVNKPVAALFLPKD